MYVRWPIRRWAFWADLRNRLRLINRLYISGQHDIAGPLVVWKGEWTGGSHCSRSSSTRLPQKEKHLSGSSSSRGLHLPIMSLQRFSLFSKIPLPLFLVQSTLLHGGENLVCHSPTFCSSVFKGYLQMHMDADSASVCAVTSPFLSRV